ncbi:hypothetical protein [Laceyella putida]|uniref:Uncharacterized protein n=1 Tax=Laceyella putida TaxID=110101 RepID=A0ABW2RQX2_9BACL
MLYMNPSQFNKIYTGGRFHANPQSLTDLKGSVDLISRFAVEEIIVMDPIHYDFFVQNLDAPHSFLKGNGGFLSTELTMQHVIIDMEEWDNEMWDTFRRGSYLVCQAIFKGVVEEELVSIDYHSGLLVDAQGEDTVQYAMMANEEVVKDVQADIHKRFQRRRSRFISPIRFFPKK